MAWKQTLRELWQKEKWYWLAAVVLGVLLSLLFAAHWTEGYADMIQKGIGGKVVRFHVLANSDSEADQTLKLAVRDRFCRNMAIYWKPVPRRRKALAALKKRTAGNFGNGGGGGAGAGVCLSRPRISGAGGISL